MVDADTDGDEARALRPLRAVGVTCRIAFGTRAGHKMFTLPGAMPREPSLEQACVDFIGFRLHAAVRGEASERERLVQLRRYMTRPALCDERAQSSEAGQAAAVRREGQLTGSQIDEAVDSVRPTADVSLKDPTSAELPSNVSLHELHGVHHLVRGRARHAVWAHRATWPAASRCTRPLAKAGWVIQRHSRSSRWRFSGSRRAVAAVLACPRKRLVRRRGPVAWRHTMSARSARHDGRRPRGPRKRRVGFELADGGRGGGRRFAAPQLRDCLL